MKICNHKEGVLALKLPVIIKRAQEISEMKLFLNARARFVAESFLTPVRASFPFSGKELILTLPMQFGA